MDDALWLQPDEVGRDEAIVIEKALQLRKGQHILDAPCGAGRVAYHLAKAGYVVTGVDIRSAFIQRAQIRFQKEGIEGSFFTMDVRELDLSGQFDGIYNWGGSFGYFSDEENSNLVQRYAEALRSGGRLLVEQTNRERTLRHFVAEIRRDTLNAVHNRWDMRTQRMLSTRTLEGKTDTKNASSMRLYTPGQMESLYGRAGLSVEGVYESASGGKYQRNSQRMFVVGRKHRIRGLPVLAATSRLHKTNRRNSRAEQVAIHGKAGRAQVRCLKDRRPKPAQGNNSNADF